MLCRPSSRLRSSMTSQHCNNAPTCHNTSYFHSKEESNKTDWLHVKIQIHSTINTSLILINTGTSHSVKSSPKKRCLEKNLRKTVFSRRDWSPSCPNYCQELNFHFFFNLNSAKAVPADSRWKHIPCITFPFKIKVISQIMQLYKYWPRKMKEHHPVKNWLFGEPCYKLEPVVPSARIISYFGAI